MSRSRHLPARLFGLLHATLTVPLGLSQHVVGIGITLLATSLTYFTYRLALPEVTSPPKIEPFQPLPIPGLSQIPILGEALFSQTPLTYLAFLTVAIVAWVLYRTPLGLALRAAGENPSAVEAQGISVTGIRIGAVMAGSALMAIGGAFLTMSAFNSFFFEMINGRGWICIALVVFGSWRPGKALIGAILFAAFDAYQIRLQQLTGGVVPYQIFLMMPYALSILALILVARRATYPRGADDPLPERRKMSFDLIVKGGTLPDGRVADIGISGETHRGDRARARRAGRAYRRCRGRPRLAALRRSAFPHGRHALLRPAAHQRVRHAAGGHRAMG